MISRSINRTHTHTHTPIHSFMFICYSHEDTLLYTMGISLVPFLWPHVTCYQKPVTNFSLWIPFPIQTHMVIKVHSLWKTQKDRGA